MLLAGLAVGVAVTALTFARHGFGEAGCVWVAAQLFLVFVAAVDAATRRIPNRLVGPAAALVLLLRAVFASGTLLQSIVAAATVFCVFAVFAVATAGFGMGDVKLAAWLGLLLAWQVLPALFVAAVGGGIGAAVLLATGRASRRASIAYGPYLCFGAAVAILFFRPPALV